MGKLSLSRNQLPQCNQSPLDGAAEKENLDVVRLLVEWGAEVDLLEGRDWTPLQSASRYGQVEVRRVFLDHGANVNTREQGDSTPLDSSACNGHLGVVELLLERDATDIEATNDSEVGKTPNQVSLQRRLSIYFGSTAWTEKGCLSGIDPL